MKKLLLSLSIAAFGLTASAQINMNIGDKVKRKVEDRVNRKVDQGIDKGLDKTEESAKKEVKKDKDAKTNSEKSGNDAASSGGNSGSSGSGSTAAASGGLKSYGKFDFVPGDKILVVEEFAQDAIGDFPAQWNTNSTGELVNVEGRDGKWLSLTKDGVFLPEFVTALPENFTLEFDLICNDDFSFYSTAFSVNLCRLAAQKDAFNIWKQYGQQQNRDGVQVSFHPQDAGGGQGRTNYIAYDKGSELMKNETATMQFYGKEKRESHVSIWRQKTRLRVYINEEKVWDLPRAFVTGTTYNSVCFTTGGFHQSQDRYLISNLKLAVGAPDTRNKLITEGRFSTSGILFDSGSDRIKPESYGVLKDIATVLKENPAVKVKIIGHTDSDGEDAANLDLSKRRALSVSKALTSEFSIEASRMTTDGKGEKEPVADNTKNEGKAMNRRVEFVKE